VEWDVKLYPPTTVTDKAQQRSTVVEHQTFAGKLPCPALDLQLQLTRFLQTCWLM